ncbi:GNAT family N-acetyltransferase [Pseudoroseicyclus tamaricis]|uniref:GNAT family N-acetyltransferase n=1 Tax=Pseudoroseicyclus tamaricis TaxID=2705421 RepID=A0A6B2JKU3_9RHOB|nr:GNAT family N-acetyltransferase [Pseudoroseicyclus tamaricis]NDV02131.1 GNAT family N-acetyltransferase [Pseudoroseicyclus tamaricis]
MPPLQPRALSADEAGDAAVALSPHIQPWHAERFPDRFKPQAEVEPRAFKLFVTGGLEGPESFAFGLGEPVEGLIFGHAELLEGNALSYERKVLKIDEIVVAPALRRQGAARALFEAALAFGREHGCSQAVLTTYEGNDGAHALFAAMGFARRVQTWVAPL